MRTSLLKLGSFHADPGDPWFFDSGAMDEPSIVFPRTAVQVQHAGRPPFVSSPNTVNFYNEGQAFRRNAVGGQPDDCDWFALAPSALAELVASFDQVAARDPSRPFVCDHVFSGSRGYLSQRLVVRHVAEHEQPDLLFVEETLVGVVRDTLATAYRAASSTQTLDPGSERTRNLARRAMEILVDRYEDNVSLAELGRALDLSPFHLCRVFKAATGQTIHAFRARLRLRSALERVEQGASLTDVALDVGFSSHSHFTDSFRREFGFTPSDYRDRTPLGLLRELRDTRIEARPLRSAPPPCLRGTAPEVARCAAN